MSPRAFLFLFYLGFLCLACDRYNPINDSIHTMPSTGNLLSDTSFRSLDDAIKNYRAVGDLHFKKALLHRDLGQAEAAKEEIELALKEDSLHPEYLLLMAELLYDSEDYLSALQFLNQAPPAEIPSLERQILKGILYYHASFYTESEQILKQSLPINPRDVRISYYLGRVAQMQSDTAKAQAYLLQSLKLDPNYADAYAAMSELYLKLEEYSESIDWANRGLRVAPKHPKLNYQKAIAYRRKLFFPDSVITYFQKALEADQELNEASLYLGKKAYEKRDYPAAQKYLEILLGQLSEHPDGNYYLGLTYRRLGQRSKAQELLEKAIKLNPQNLLARESLWQIEQEILREKIWAREDSLRKAYQKWLKEQQEKLNAPTNPE